MKHYETKQIRNVAVVGHLGTGKTTLLEAIMYRTQTTAKKGEVIKGTTISDFLVEEQQKKHSYSTTLIPVEYKDYKFNFLDVPGSDELNGELVESLSVVKGAVILIDATKGVEIGTKRVWREIRKRHIPAIIFINKMDQENIDFEKLLDNIRENLGKKAAPFCWPIGREQEFEGFVNAVSKTARIHDGLESVDAPIWEEKLPKLEELHNLIVESVVENDETLLEKYFNGEVISEDVIKHGLRKGVMNGEITPAMVGSATKNIGVLTLLDMLIDYLPAPNELAPLVATDESNQEKLVATTDETPFSGYIFKTLIDPFLGAINLVKINSGTLTNNQEVLVSNTGETKRLGIITSIRGKTLIPINNASAGDIIALTKIEGLKTGYSLCDPKVFRQFLAPVIIKPVLYLAISPKNSKDEDKISEAFKKLQDEDKTIEVVRNKETNQLLLGGQGINHLNYIIDRMKNMFKVEVNVDEQKIGYRETIKKVLTGEGKHKKQSGGSGQYGHVVIRFEPFNGEFEFTEEVFGGSVPRNYFPAVEKGLIETFEKGIVAGYPVINMKCILLDGSHHSVDSNEISFRLAASLAVRDIFEKNEQEFTLLEPIYEIDVAVDDKYVGDVMGDLNKRRGRLIGTNQKSGYQIISAYVPEAEIVKYAIDLKAMTQGSASFTRQFLKYEEVPRELQKQIIQGSK